MQLQTRWVPPGNGVPNSKHGVLSLNDAVPSSNDGVPNSKHGVLSSNDGVPNSDDAVLNSNHGVLNPDDEEKSFGNGVKRLSNKENSLKDRVLSTTTGEKSQDPHFAGWTGQMPPARKCAGMWR
jgi:hypothetical protein